MSMCSGERQVPLSKVALQRLCHGKVPTPQHAGRSGLAPATRREASGCGGPWCSGENVAILWG